MCRHGDKDARKEEKRNGEEIKREKKRKERKKKKEKKSEGKKLGPTLWRFGTHGTGLLLCIVHRAFFDDLRCTSTLNTFREDEYI